MLPVREFLEIDINDECEQGGTLTRAFDVTEMQQALHGLARGKSPGPDGISNEFLRALPVEGQQWLLDLYNDFLRTGNIPPGWSNSAIVMLHKKGNRTDPENYRPISLLNTTLKLFTQLLQNRLSSWAEEGNYLPEAQAGFRKGRNCDDQIFCLSHLVNRALRKRGGKLFCLFVDFKGRSLRYITPFCLRNLEEWGFPIGF